MQQGDAMQKLFIILTLCLAGTAHAQHRPYPHHHHHHGGGWGWVVPAIIGGAVVYGAIRPSTPPPPTVIYVPQGYPRHHLDFTTNSYWMQIAIAIVGY